MNTTEKDTNDNATLPPPSRIGTVRQVIRFTSIQEVRETAKALYEAGCTPSGVDRPDKLIPIILTGAELGLGIMQSLKSVTPAVNGVCSLYGDIGLALVRQSGLLAEFSETIEGDDDNLMAVCTIRRHGYQQKRFEYPLAKAKKLRGYLGAQSKKVGVWYDDPQTMLRWRARWLALRSEFTDILMGMTGTEELDEETITVDVVVPPPPPTPALPPASTGPTEDQLAEIARIKKLMIGGLPPGATEEDIKSYWLAELSAFGVSTVRDLTRDKTAEFMLAVGKKYDPFTYPPTTGTT